MDRQRLIAELTVDEKRVAVVYDDANGQPIVKGYTVIGNPTIGIGRNVADPGLYVGEPEVLLNNDINNRITGLDTELPWWSTLDDVRQNALLDMAFNLGIPKLLGFDTFLGYLKDGHYEDAANDLLGTLWYRQVGARAHRVMERIRSGEWLT
ncbi:MAG: glycoside hydrolase family protein [Sulfobacillus sp.]